MFTANMNIKDYDPVLWQAIQDENRRQEEHIELIASENYASPRVMEAQGSQFTNKYAEGYPGKRYYGGCEYADIVEQLAIDRAKKLFGADYANVQPHSGSQANAAVYGALINAGDTILGMDLAHGGHLTHGAKVSFSGKIYNSVLYGITADGVINYEDVRQKALEPEYKEYQANVIKNAKAMVEVFKQRGYDVVSNGTENHLFLVSFIKQGLTGKAADAALGKANITVNKNAVPNDPQKPFVTSGIRVGTPSVTRRGFNENDVRELANWMCDVLDVLGKENEEQVISETKEKVLAICKRLPVYTK